MPNNERSRDIVDIVLAITSRLDQAGIEYAIGGAVALGFWAVPRGTVDADVTVFLSTDAAKECVALLQKLHCVFGTVDALLSLKEHGFCRVDYDGFQLDVFLPTISFYEVARKRRRVVPLDGGSIMIWDAETLCVFKLMFFRLKDLADVESIIRVQAEQLDRNWVLVRLLEIYGSGDPRVSRWNELAGGKG